MNEKSCRYIFIYDILYKTLIDAKPMRIRFDKVDGFIRNFDETRRYDNLEVKNMISFTTGLDIL